MMIPEVRELLLKAKEDYIKSLDLKEEQALYVGFEQFKKLIIMSMKKKQGVGRSYIYAPKKKPDVTVQLMLEAESGLTFKPDLSLIPPHIIESRVNTDKEVMVNHLYSQHEEMKVRKEKLREKLMKDELKGCTFQPKLYKPPDSVKASYRHHGQHSKQEKPKPNNDIRNSPGFVAVNSQSKPLSQSLLSTSVVTVDKTQITLSPTQTPMSMSQSSAHSMSASMTSVNDGDGVAEEYTNCSSTESPLSLSRIAPTSHAALSPPPPPLPVEVAMEAEAAIEVEAVVEHNHQTNDGEIESDTRMRRTSSDLSSLEAAGVRDLGSYDESYHRQRDAEMEDNVALERSESSDLLSAMISQEIEEYTSNSDVPNQNVPLSGEGSAEIDSNPIPFETYINITENGNDQDGHSSREQSMNPFDFVEITSNEGEGEEEGIDDEERRRSM